MKRKSCFVAFVKIGIIKDNNGCLDFLGLNCPLDVYCPFCDPFGRFDVILQ